jgi:hypothetical protein
MAESPHIQSPGRHLSPDGTRVCLFARVRSKLGGDCATVSVTGFPVGGFHPRGPQHDQQGHGGNQLHSPAIRSAAVIWIYSLVSYL